MLNELENSEDEKEEEEVEEKIEAGCSQRSD